MRKIGLNKGYRLVHCPGHHRAWSTGYVYEHILVIESVLNRKLNPDEVVHHKDGDRTNNDPSNLELMPDRRVHAQLHGQERSVTMVELTCSFCGVIFLRRKGNDPIAKGYSHAYCTRSCSGRALSN